MKTRYACTVGLAWLVRSVGIATFSCGAIGSSAPPKWNAAGVVQRADAVIVVAGPSTKRVYPGAPAPKMFGRDGDAPIHVYTTIDVLGGDVEIGSELVIVQPPGMEEHRFAPLVRGEALLFLRRMERNEVEELQANMPAWARELPNEVWTFVEQTYQWMNHVQFVTVARDAVDTHPRGVLVAQLNRYADVEPTKETIVAYVRGLVELRDAALENQPTPAAETLDVFQQDVVRAATEERAERERERQEAERQEE